MSTTLVPPDTATVPGDAPAPSGSAALRRMMLRLHFYVGLLVGPFLLVAALSGVGYALSPTLERIVNHDQLVAASPAVDTPLDRQLDTARAVHPDLQVSRIVPGSGGSTTRVLFADPTLPTSSYSRVVFVDPSDGAVRGDTVQYGSSQALPLRTWISEFHRRLHLGEPGRLYSELAASWLAPLALGGLYLWWRRRRAGSMLRVDRGRIGRAVQRERHAVWGVWALAGMLVLAATGLTWSTYAGGHVAELRKALDWTTPTISAPSVGGGGVGAAGGAGDGAGSGAGVGGAGDGAAGDDAAAHAAMGHGSMGAGSMGAGSMGHGSMGHGAHSAPDGMTHGSGHDEAAADPLAGASTVLAAARADGLTDPIALTPPIEPGTAWTAAESPRSWSAGPDSVAVDGRNGTVVERLPFADYPLPAKLTDWGIRLHMGFLFGLANQLLLAAVAVAITVVTVRGYVMWWMRRPTRGRAGDSVRRASRRGLARPPARGAVRDLVRTHPVSTVVGLCVVVVIGWAIPLLGLSLAAFVALDVAIGTVARLRARRRVVGVM